MRCDRAWRVLTLFSAVLLLATLAAAKTKTTHKNSSSATAGKAKLAKKAGKTSARHSRSRRSKKMAWRYRGQQKPDSERTREIQAALIRENYLHGQPSGVWDQGTREAMVRFQQDHGWQTKMVPDARALIELGLGPRNDNLINPESAMTSGAVVGTGGAADRDMPATARFRQ